MRPIWSGSLSFGLVHIPVKLYSAAIDRVLKFHLLEKGTLCPISYKKVCKANGKPVDYADIVRGFEIAKGEYVVMKKEDFEKASPRKTKTVEIESFADEDEVDSIYYEKPYYIEPDKKAIKAYALLCDALKKSKKVAVARFVLREHEHIATIKPEGDMLILNQMRFHQQIRPPEELDTASDAKYSAKELKIALSLIKQMDQKFDITAFEDEYTEKLEKMIAAKKKGKHYKVSKDDKQAFATDMSELMEMLQQSLGKQKEKHHAR